MIQYQLVHVLGNFFIGQIWVANVIPTSIWECSYGYKCIGWQIIV